ncbi:MAG: ABC transporter ATP-binding protein [Acidobacteria bacterium]|nr:ABC transporter ATP-binding protein [Acidobacteriota bacterium]
MIDAVELTRTYLRRAVVDAVSFTIEPGEVLGYLGPNGSGKSTTVKMLTGMLEPTGGRVLYRGANIRHHLLEYKRILGYVPEEPYLYPYLTGREYLQLAGRLRDLPEKILDRKIDALLNSFSLFEHRHSPISSYSKGMKQKVLITAALLHDPEVLIFDEPLSGLDVTSAMVFKNLIRVLARKGKIILYSSHVLEVVEKICTRVIILRQGKVVAHDSVDRLRTLMQSPSLEDVFSQLVMQEDTERVAEEMVAVM